MVFLCGQGPFPRYCAALAAVGLTALVGEDPASAARCSGLLLPGGGDILGPLSRDEAAVIRHFVTRQRPILGICRGMQALNVYFGGTLRFITGHRAGDGSADLLHPTCATGVASSLLGAHPTVNSNHHQALDKIATELSVCQWTQDGVAECVVHRTLPIFAVQYHPERMTGEVADGGAIFRYFAAQMAAAGEKG